MSPYRNTPQRISFHPFRLHCEVPSCRRWFKNKSGLTQHMRKHHTNFSCSRPSVLTRTESLNRSEQEEHGTGITPPAAEHVAAGAGHQDDWPHEHDDGGGHQEDLPHEHDGATSDEELDGMEVEFIGSGNRVYRNYHPGLTGALPPPHVQKLPNDWTPYHSRLEFEVAEFLFIHAEMPAKKIDTLLDFWAASLLPLGGTPLFANHKDLYCMIDRTSVGTVQWENFKIRHKRNVQHAPDEQNEQDEQGKLIELEDGEDGLEAPWMFDIYDIWYRDPRQVVHNLLGRADIKDEMDFVPYREFDGTNEQRRWENFMSGDWAWNEAIIRGDPSTAGATLVPIILSSDKTTVSVATGQTDYYPLYLSIGNVHNTTRRAHRDAVVLIAFLAMPKSTREHASTQMFRRFKKRLFHRSLTRILQSLRPAMTTPQTVLCGDQYYRRVLYSLAAHIADYEEQALLSCIELDPQLLWVVYGIDGDVTLIKGGFKDHLVDWVERYLIQTHGKSAAEKVLDEIDKRIAAVALFAGLRRFPQGWHFKQWTSDDSKGLMKVYIAAIEGFVPRDVIRTFRAFLEFCYLVRRNIITEQTLTVIDDALNRFHLYHEVFRNAEVVTTFSLPRQHAMKHYPYLICQFGAPNGLCSSITESKHIKAVKRPYRRTNRFQALGQMLLINQRLDKLAAAHVDFQDHGMLTGTCLLDAIGTQGHNNHHNEAGHPHDASSNRSSGIDADKPTASYEEEEGDTDDSPMSVKAHVSLAQTHHKNSNRLILERKRARNMQDLAIELNTPRLIDTLRRFLQLQLYRDDDRDLEDVPLDECPLYDGSVHVYNSACSTFYAPSDTSGIHGMCREYIRSCPEWRNTGPRYDCVYVVTEPRVEGMLGLDVARVLCFFSFNYLGTDYPCAIIRWFDRVGDVPDADTGMWIVRACNPENIAIIHIDAIYRAAQLIPIYAAHHIDPGSVKPHESYDKYQSFYVNKFADHHAFEIAS
ncbi:hypothetical protein EDD15DRAFT_2387356 [Pisolithus albus]|nr:hypothetical protein EDD15DRAFT_2387356 [Pisolithus albus]